MPSSSRSEGVIDLKQLNTSLHSKYLRQITDGYSSTDGISTPSNITPSQTGKRYLCTINGALQLKEKYFVAKEVRLYNPQQWLIQTQWSVCNVSYMKIPLYLLKHLNHMFILSTPVYIA